MRLESRLGRFLRLAQLLIALTSASAAIGCGGSTQENCRPAIGGDVAANASAQVRPPAANVDASGDANANARVNIDASADVPPTEAQLREAAELRARARVNIDAGRLREALPDLERAFGLSRDVTLLGDLGLSLQAAGRLEEAWQALARFRAEARAAYEPVRVKIDAALGDLEKQLGGLVIDADAPGAVVLVRGRIVARLPMASPIYLAPGDITALLRAPGKPEASIHAHITLGSVAHASATLPTVGGGLKAGLGGIGGTVGGIGGTLGGAVGGIGGTVGGIGAGTVGGITGNVPSVGAPDLGGTVGTVGGIGGAVTAPIAAAPALPIWPIVVGVGGLAVIGGSIAASVSYSGTLDDLDANLCGKSGASPQCPSLEASADLTTGLQVVGYILGGAALTTGIVVFAVTRSAKTPDLECPKVGRAPSVTVKCSPFGSSDGGGLGCAGTF